MRLRPYRRNLVWSPHVRPLSPYGVPRATPVARTRRIRRWIHLSGLLTVLGLIRLARGMRTRWRPLLAGGVLTVVVMLRSGIGAVDVLPAAACFLLALLTPARAEPTRKRRSELERELAAYSTPAQRADLEATLDLYPDDITGELRDILTGQAIARL
jgi:hypothetical protein